MPGSLHLPFPRPQIRRPSLLFVGGDYRQRGCLAWPAICKSRQMSFNHGEILLRILVVVVLSALYFIFCNLQPTVRRFTAISGPITTDGTASRRYRPRRL